MINVTIATKWIASTFAYNNNYTSNSIVLKVDFTLSKQIVRLQIVQDIMHALEN